tara:strand:+ start:1142 stop:1528 length:387 start_codon:yes stop_codon:yes gene_type:complete
MNPSHQFNAYISNFTNPTTNKILWKATIEKSKFPELNDHTTEKTYHLNPDTYKDSFQYLSDIFNQLPSQLFNYTVSTNGDSLYITGVTETTVQEGVVDLVKSVIPNANVNIIKPYFHVRIEGASLPLE